MHGQKNNISELICCSRNAPIEISVDSCCDPIFDVTRCKDREGVHEIRDKPLSTFLGRWLAGVDRYVMEPRK